MKARLILVSLAIILASILGQQTPAASAKQNTLFYEVKMKCPLGDMGTRRMYMKGSNFVFEVDSAGFKTKFIKNSDGSFLLHPTRPFAREYPAGSPVEQPTVFLAGPNGDVKAFLKANKAVKAGKAKLAGKSCDIYKYTETHTLLKCQLWVDSKTGLPVQLVTKGNRQNDTTTATYVSYKMGVTIADSRFELPKGITVRPYKPTESLVPPKSGAGAPKDKAPK